MNMGDGNTPADSTGSSEAARAAKSASGVTAQRPTEARVTKPKRSVVHVACACCRRLRIKCDGNRPTCQPCAKRYEDCVYDVEANTTRSNALKRKNEELTKENAKLRELYAFVRDRPPREAEEIFRRIRTTQDPLDVLKHVSTAELLVAQAATSSSQTQNLDTHTTTLNGKRTSRLGSKKYDPVYDD
ncbi:hypothetical protein AUEXF2481DRAFT_80686 [Aureobasidium subglaciale EXF-2481]|uniref:Zn(2)-C6 fungal-type domain-containing protein n=1 Tax=Aureobasidium subglaciale (strain EXF-2481) TaxID=1043005 RepID=A0A074YK23_AURSE|nr:uncharacterized protein AUEXF2481DRAFT_80686 [Aureobasidium subglaciale EXF-2481]KAI5209664.1 hypothetical protein E4T38_02336 [Aureobasidium subglaciale]KAI5228557.1 hypothetical protein E4T40_02115 [Aureobasidium subglaciale]KAI5231946.1 hypothetical protein E4T41_02335 [Aureobasidium subglaciale]KAI5265802.1 hypothetical protein E4T46_02113 [Aureobasidium subglaciale]KEQ94452.1 hypothetical protein AUEXF2481DRAFT_80686 [Aureobasidium subglaciale EXF-2481]